MVEDGKHASPKMIFNHPEGPQNGMACECEHGPSATEVYLKLCCSFTLSLLFQPTLLTS